MKEERKGVRVVTVKRFGIKGTQLSLDLVRVPVALNPAAGKKKSLPRGAGPVPTRTNSGQHGQSRDHKTDPPHGRLRSRDDESGATQKQDQGKGYSIAEIKQQILLFRKDEHERDAGSQQTIDANAKLLPEVSHGCGPRVS
ncbi:MAG TPA: hypothetical protein VFE33_04105 [Thermoanaerobaculia bacterium]|nr:hypothetical protein [Thermoanaerobaculia bacterium]